MKGCLLIVGFMVAGAALAIGLVVVLERDNAAEHQALTRQSTDFETTKRTPEFRGSSQERVAGRVLEYRYETGGRWYESSMWLPAVELGDLDVCVDPDDPAVHTIRTRRDVACGEGNVSSGAVHRAEPAPSGR